MRNAYFIYFFSLIFIQKHSDSIANIAKVTKKSRTVIYWYIISHLVMRMIMREAQCCIISPLLIDMALCSSLNVS